VNFVAPERIVVDRAFLARELGAPRAASMVLVHIADHFRARAEARAIEAELPEVEALAWTEDAPFLGHALSGSAAVAAISKLMIILAVVIPVWALLYMHVLHRKRDIAMLGALGFSGADVFLIFLLQSLLVAVLGARWLWRWLCPHRILPAASRVLDGLLRHQAGHRAGGPRRTRDHGVLRDRARRPRAAWRASRLDPARVLRGPE
jgi:hypothetical protein